MIAAAAALFAACSSNDTFKEVNDEVKIGFEGKYVNKQTRAELDYSWFTTNNNSFGVYGYKGTTEIFGAQSSNTAEKVTWNTNDWTNTTTRFWDKSSQDYNFYAYAPVLTTSPFTQSFSYNTSTKKGNFTFSQSNIITNTSVDGADIVIATPIEGTSYAECCTSTATGHGNGHVEFTFNHIFSKLAFKVWTSVDPTIATIKVTGIALDFPTAATVNWAQDRATANKSWSGTTTYTTYNAASAVLATAENEVTTYSIPVANTKNNAMFQTSVFSGTSENLPYKNAASATAIDLGDKFIVTPVTASGASAEHIFGVKITYDLTYVNGPTETGCIAAGVIGGGTTNQYKPNQNDSYVITIDVNPAKIEFCVDNVANWETETSITGEVK
jgi:hypothetical protein